VPGSDPELDAAIQVQPMLLDLLRHRGWKLQLTATE